MRSDRPCRSQPRSPIVVGWHDERSAYVPVRVNALEDATARLAMFSAIWADGDIVDEPSVLTAADLDIIISFAPALKLDVEAMGLTDNR